MKNKNTKLWHGRSRRHAHLTPTSRQITVTVQNSPASLRKTSPYGRNKANATPTQRFPLSTMAEETSCDDDDDEPSQEECASRSPSDSVSESAPSECAGEDATFCVRQTVPSHAMFALTKISSLLQYVSPGALVAFDIDDTLVKKRHFSCSLLTAEGSRAFQAHLQQRLPSLSFAEKQRLVNALHQHVKAFTLAENETAAVVSALQNRGVRVFGLTARSSSMAAATAVSLAELGIDLTRSTPITLPQRAIEPSTGAAVVDGVVYCGDVDKGVVFQRLLQLGWLSWASPVAAPSSPSTPDGSSQLTVPTPEEAAQQQLHPPSDNPVACPERTVWFVDDSLPMINGMVSSWVAMASAQQQLYASFGAWADKMPCRGRLSLVCCHYTHPTAAAAIPTPAEAVPAVVAAQIDEFLATGSVLSDADALARLSAGRQAAAGVVAAC